MGRYGPGIRLVTDFFGMLINIMCVSPTCKHWRFNSKNVFFRSDNFCHMTIKTSIFTLRTFCFRNTNFVFTLLKPDVLPKVKYLEITTLAVRQAFLF